MRKTAPIRCVRPGQQGYALLVIIFLLALLVIAVSTVAPNVITNARREQEEEMIWRGKQYTRGIRLYYTKLHKFPNALDDLYKPKTGVRFMRQAYKDPMNKADGSWRMIYVGPNGMLIGSLKNRNVNIAGQPQAGFGGAINGPGTVNSATGSSSAFGSSNGFGSASSFGSGSSFGSNNSFGANNAGATPGVNPQAPGNPIGQPNGIDDSEAALQAQAATVGDTVIIGGNIIGVGSKINKKSIQWYERSKNYLQFEFVWDPSVDSLTGSKATIPTNNPNTFGTFGNAANPAGNPNPVQNTPVTDPNMNPPLQAPPNQ